MGQQHLSDPDSEGCAGMSVPVVKKGSFFAVALHVTQTGLDQKGFLRKTADGAEHVQGRRQTRMRRRHAQSTRHE